MNNPSLFHKLQEIVSLFRDLTDTFEETREDPFYSTICMLLQSKLSELQVKEENDSADELMIKCDEDQVEF